MAKKATRTTKKARAKKAVQVRSIGDMRASEVLTWLEDTGQTSQANDVRALLMSTRGDPKYSTLLRRGMAAVGGPESTTKGLSLGESLMEWLNNLTRSPAERQRLQAWSWSKSAYGFIPSGDFSSTARVDILDIRNGAPDRSLTGESMNVTLDHLRIFGYPGQGTRKVMFEFTGNHDMSAQGSTEVKFSQVYSVDAVTGEAGFAGYPVFLGLNVGTVGLQFKCQTVFVESEQDRQLLSFMESGVFQQGLKLLTTWQPALKMVTEYATGLASGLIKRQQGRVVQQVDLGLYFSTAPTRPKMREGSYIIVQVDREDWDWNLFEYHPAAAEVRLKSAPDAALPFNYFIFSVSR